MRDYGFVYTCFWTDPQIQFLSDQAKILALYLLTGPHTNMLGCFRLPLGYIEEDLQWPAEIILKKFEELSRIGFIIHDPYTDWIIISKFLKWNRIENPNQGKSVAKLFEKIPPKSKIFPFLVKLLLMHGKHLGETFNNHLQTLSKQFPQPFLNQEQEQKQEQKQEQEQKQKDERVQNAQEGQKSEQCALMLRNNAPIIHKPIISIPLRNRNQFDISQALFDKWQSIYPDVDVLKELQEILDWNIRNPKKQKTLSGIDYHITRWLAEVQEYNSRKKEKPPPKNTLDEHNHAVGKRWLQNSQNSMERRVADDTK